MKIALVHDFFNEAGGAERVLRVLADMYPDAPIYVAFAKNGTARKMLSDRKIIESPWGWFLKIGHFYSYFRFLLPWIWQSVDLGNYDLVITSCSSYIARGFRVGSQTKVIAYCHTPPKWLYGYETSTNGHAHWWGRAYMWIVGPFVRYFDFISAQKVNVWVANSQEVSRRIEKFYRKKATVVYPPAFISESANQRISNQNESNYYLAVARVVGAKGLELSAQAARAKKTKLIVVGELIGGRRVADRVQEAGGEWVELVGRVSEERLADLYRNAKGYLALARDEDFGMTVVESMSYGTPVIALRSGGYKETVISANQRISESIDGLRTKSANQKNKKITPTGIFVEKADVKSVVEAMGQLEKTQWDREGIQKLARQFDRTHFEKASAK